MLRPLLNRLRPLCICKEEVAPLKLHSRTKTKVRSEEPSMSKSKFVVEYAKSARAACKLCGEAIPKGAVRLGSITKADAGFDVTKWHHPNCFFNHNDNHGIPGLDKIGGFPSLKNSDQAALKKNFAKCKTKDPESASAETRAGESKGAMPIIDGVDSWEAKLSKFCSSQLCDKYKEAVLLEGWKAFSTVILRQYAVDQSEGVEVAGSVKIAAFDFDGCLANTSVRRPGADAWSLLYPSIPAKLASYHSDGYKLVIFSNESNIERWKNSRQKAVDSKLGRLNGFLEQVKLPMQVFVACGREGTGDPCRKPKTGMWSLLEHSFNGGVPIDIERSFYVGDAAGRPGDHSSADIEFAKALGLKFFVPEDIFASSS